MNRKQLTPYRTEILFLISAAPTARTDATSPARAGTLAAGMGVSPVVSGDMAAHPRQLNQKNFVLLFGSRDIGLGNCRTPSDLA